MTIREQKRNEVAEKVCQELRYQLAEYGGIVESDKIMRYLTRWMKLAKKNKYDRPQQLNKI